MLLMSTIGTLELLLHLEKFRNIDLYYQGLYFIKISCALPNSILSSKEIYLSPQKLPDYHPHGVRDPWMTETECTSPVFFLRYSEEIVELNVVCGFTGEVEIKPGYLDQPLELTVDLYFNDLDGTITLPKVLDAVADGFDKLVFKKISTARFKVANPMLGASQYIPIIFDELYSCVFHSMLHCSLTNYQFALNKQLVTDEETVASVLFPGTPDPLSVDVIEKAYHSTVMLLTLTFNKIRRLLLNLCKVSGIHNRRQVIPPSLKLPVTVDLLTKMHFSMDSKLSKFPLTTCISSRNPIVIAKVFIQEIAHVAKALADIRKLLIQMVRDYRLHTNQIMEFSFLQSMKARWEENMVVEHRSDLTTADLNRAKSQSQVATKKRFSNSFRFIESLEVEDLGVLPPAEHNPILFEEILSGHSVSGWSPDWFSSQQLPELRSNAHVFVLVHGLMGTSFDMKFVRDIISLHRPQSLILMSRSNENQTEGSIEDAGRNLAIEVQAFLEGCVRVKVEKISFVGHSLGGLIIRAALPLLVKYKDKMYTLITLSSPHLGCTHSKSKLVGAGLWVITKFKRSHSLKQLGIVDTNDPRTSFIYSLSKTQGLEWFKHLILISSEQDNYVPFESARIEGNNELQIEMAQSLLDNLKRTKVVRINVNFGKSGSRIGTLIGRTAHIRMLDNKAFLTMLMYRYAEAFY